MNLIKVISSEEPIGGLEIEGGALRFALLKKSRNGLEATTLVEDKLSSQEGSINGAAFVDKLTKFVKKHQIKYVVISIPTSGIFSKTYSFPAAMLDDKIAESMQLTVDLQLPKKSDTLYCDWMPTETTENDKKILLSYIIKTQADALLAIAKKAGLKVVAVETRAMSLARAIKQNKDEPILLVEKMQDNYAFSVLINNNVLFSQSLPVSQVGDNFDKEIRKIVNYHGWFNINIKQLVLLGNFPEGKIKKLDIKLINPTISEAIKKAATDIKWLVVLGSAMRGLLPRKSDEIISLMDIGTETAYRRERANTTINFFIGISVALSIFFAVAFVATWSLLSVLQNNYTKQISAFNLLPSSDNTNSLKDKAAEFNSLIEQAGFLVNKEANWSKVVSEIKTKTVPDIAVNNLSLPSIDGTLSLTGTAANRTAINNLKTSFESSELFTNVMIPLDNLGKKSDIPFSLTFKIKDVNLVYGK
jgi:Tfp pilus assembly PilM family ATPase